MLKLLLILMTGSALLGSLASAQSEPPLLIDASPAPFVQAR
ncbi:MAG TPA: hypothetical protein VJM15_08365 [Sphingomicrobium sp.]|jgi:hypothetical protein|nr:hypothetical protein [Sphingomicrobium sp.]